MKKLVMIMVFCISSLYGMDKVLEDSIFSSFCYRIETKYHDWDQKSSLVQLLLYNSFESGYKDALQCKKNILLKPIDHSREAVTGNSQDVHMRNKNFVMDSSLSGYKEGFYEGAMQKKKDSNQFIFKIKEDFERETGIFWEDAPGAQWYPYLVKKLKAIKEQDEKRAS
jgi:hypothetical protein